MADISSPWDDRYPLVADISLWQWFRNTGYPHPGASAGEVDEAFDRIIGAARNYLILVPAPQAVLDALDSWLEDEKPDGVEVTSEHVARAERWGAVRDYRRLIGSAGAKETEANDD